MLVKDLTKIEISSSHEIKAVFLDIDGTVVNAQHQITPATREAIAQLQQQGVRVSLATGRANFGTKNVVAALNIDQLCVFTSGALIINPKTNEQIFSSEFDSKFILDLAQWLESKNFYIELYSTSDYFISKHSPFAEIHAEYLGHYPTLTSFTELTQKTSIIKIQSMIDQKDQADELQEMLKPIKELNVAITNSAAHPYMTFFNITHSSASRENAFATLISHWNMDPKEVASFGDGESDIPFLSLSGAGVAMGNAPKKVHQAARYVTKSVEEDGVAFALKKLGCI